MRKLSSWRLLAVTFISLFGLFGSATAAQTEEKVMLVLDASGSMWARIDGKEKILIAREVVNDMLGTWDENIHLGLIAYGHRRKGDCSDIETLVPTAKGTMNNIGKRVNSLQPKGKTPLTAAVLKAAEELRYSEDKATVILVSDGKETCDLDPCEVGRKLEQTGVNFTAHVIGFDVSVDEKAGLECLARETGGQYLDAQKADELKVALETVVQQVKTQPDRVVLVLGNSGEQYANVNMKWRAEHTSGAVTEATGSGFQLPLEAGEYQITANLGNLNSSGRVNVGVGDRQIHELALDAARVVLEADASLGGEKVANPRVDWTVVPSADQDGAEKKTGNKARITLMAGEYEVYGKFEGLDESTTALVEAGESQTIKLSFALQPASLNAPDTAALGSEVEIQWDGPDQKNDYISVANPDDEGRRHIKYAYTKKGSPVKLQMPDKVGAYELRYIAGASKAVLARRAISITAVDVSLSAPEQTDMGAKINIEWTGPNNKNDYITVVKADAGDEKYKDYAYTKKGSPLELNTGDVPGAYEIRYISGQSKSVLARRALQVLEVRTNIDAPETAPISAALTINWTGPDGERDYLTVVPPDAADNKYGKYEYTAKGSPVDLQMPDLPGVYELRYVSGQSKSVLARHSIEIKDVAVTINASDKVGIGSTITIEWTGPGASRDYITVVGIEEDDKKYGKYVYTNKAGPVKLQMPDQAGTYELRYVLGQSKTVKGRKLISIEDVAAGINALNTAAAGAPLRIEWIGPANSRDAITVAELTQPDNKYRKQVWASKTPVDLMMPKEPGTYELRYVSGQSAKAIARRIVQVVAAEEHLAALTAQPTGSVKLSAKGENTGNAISENIQWQLYPIVGKQGEITSSSEAAPTLTLSPGVYRVIASAGGASESGEFILNSGQTIDLQIAVTGQ